MADQIDNSPGMNLLALVLIISASLFCNYIGRSLVKNEYSYSNYLRKAFRGDYQHNSNGEMARLSKETIAIHEASHAVVSAISGTFTRKDELKIFNDADEDFRLNGHFTAFYNILHCESITLIEVRMLVYLAGVEGELLFSKNRAVGGSCDYERWRVLAHHYLLCQPDIVYFRKPKTLFEHDHNMRLMTELKSKQREVVVRLLLANSEVVHELTRGLLEHEFITGDYLYDQLSKVVCVPGCPALSDQMAIAIRRESEAQSS